MVKPILDVDVERGTRYLVENTPRMTDFTLLDEYQRDAIASLSGH